MSYPATFTVERPHVFRREQVALRVVLLIAVGWVGHPFGLLWLGVPAVAAVLISKKGGQRYRDEDGEMMTRALGWILSFIAYLALLTDELPSRSEPTVHYTVEPGAAAPARGLTVGSALARILRAIPSLIALAILLVAGAVAWLMAVIMILISESYPEGIWRFLLGIVRWQAYVLAYLASLVDQYPPFDLETSPVAAAS